MGNVQIKIPPKQKDKDEWEHYLSIISLEAVKVRKYVLLIYSFSVEFEFEFEPYLTCCDWPYVFSWANFGGGEVEIWWQLSCMSVVAVNMTTADVYMCGGPKLKLSRETLPLTQALIFHHVCIFWNSLLDAEETWTVPEDTIPTNVYTSSYLSHRTIQYSGAVGSTVAWM